MANSNTYIEGFGDTQITTLSHIQGAGLNLPPQSTQFIDIRSPNKLQTLFETPQNSHTLYTKYKPYDSHLKGPIASPYLYTDIETGQKNKIRTSFDSSLKDGERIRKFLGSSVGSRFVLKQLTLQGFQPFDETKVYNPASPVIAALRLASFGLLDRPTRHIDTSNVVGGLLGATGLGSVVRTVGTLFGGGSLPSPPRSSVASAASRPGGFLGITGATFSSLIGGADRSNEVVSPLARPYVKGLLRGGTATNAYNSPRYSKLVANNPGFLKNLLSGVGSFFQNNTVIGGILPPKQPWAATYRADEQTYSLYLGAGKLFDPTYTGVNPGGILGGLLNSIGFGKKANYSLNTRQRFFRLSERGKTPNFNRSIVITRSHSKSSFSTFSDTNEIAIRNIGSDTISTKAINVESDPKKNYYTDVVFFNENVEQSDQLLNYIVFTDQQGIFDDNFSAKIDPNVRYIIDSFNKVKRKISFSGYSTSDKLGHTQQFITDNIGFDFINKVKPNGETSNDDYTYTGRFRNGNDSFTPSRLGKIEDKDRFIRPTNKTDYVNSLGVLTKTEFDEKYNSPEKFNGMGPDIIKFFFYDIVNEKYIPFNATVKGIQDNNTAEWETVEYVGRADKLYYYKGFKRSIAFNFTTVAGSIKELMPMWKRINYLASLTKPANYTNGSNGGFIVPPMLQLTLGDFFKNHFVVMNQCTISIPEDTTWEILPEGMSRNNQNWFWGPNVANISLYSSKEKYAQFPMSADIQINMDVLEKDRPQAGRGMWGDFPISNDKIPTRNFNFSDNLIEDEKLLEQVIDIRDNPYNDLPADFYFNTTDIRDVPAREY